MSECRYEAKNFTDKCTSLKTLHHEDERFIYSDVNIFLSSLTRHKGTEVNKYKQVVILLNDTKQYIGHIYIWSWLSAVGKFRDSLYTLEFASIRTPATQFYMWR